MDAINEAAVWTLFREAAEESDCQVWLGYDMGKGGGVATFEVY